ncbi:MAG: PsbP-related protein [Thermoleophilia bacterium]
MFVIALVAMLTVLLAACGSQDSSGTDSGAVETTPYTNAQYGFSLEYSEPYGVVTDSTVSGEEYAIAFADKDGTVINDQYATGVRVSVYELEQAIKAADVPKLETEMSKVLNKMITALPGGKTTSEVKTTKLNGTPGYTVDYVFTEGGEELTSRLYILIKGTNEYHVSAQAASDEWADKQDGLEAIVQTFTLD